MAASSRDRVINYLRFAAVVEDYESHAVVEVDSSSDVDVSSWSDTPASSRGDGAIRRGDGSAVKRPLTRRRRKRQRSGKWTYSPSRGWRRVIRVVPSTGTLRAKPPGAAVRPWNRDRRELGPMPPTYPPPPHLLPIGFPIGFTLPPHLLPNRRH